jgi:hypothetical protein
VTGTVVTYFAELPSLLIPCVQFTSFCGKIS